MSYRNIVSIDGPAGSGKSSTAKAVAKELGLPNLNTGLIYRAAGWQATRQSFIDTGQQCAEYFAGSVVHIYEDKDWRHNAGYVVIAFPDGNQVKHFITDLRLVDASDAASKIGDIPEMGPVLVEMMRATAKLPEYQDGFVAEGRNIGSAVFTDALLKVYLDAESDVRCNRIAALHGEEVARLTLERDKRDAARAFAPLCKPEGALEIDSTLMGSRAVVTEIVGQFHAQTRALSEQDTMQ